MHGISNYVIMNEGNIAYPNVAIWCTKGSGLNNRFGASVYGHSDNHRESMMHDIVIKCNWVVTRWQYTFTHKQYIEQHK
jgi:hypothetical protein